MERTFNIYRFKGITQYRNGKEKFLQQTLKECLNNINTSCYNTYDTTEELFKSRGLFIFESEALTADQLREKIGKGLTVFSVSKTQRITEIRAYLDKGFDPVFMRASDFKTFLKAYAE